MLFTLSSTFLVLFGFFGVLPLASSTFDIYGELEKGRTYEAALIQKLAALEEAKKNFAIVSNRLEEIEEAIPSDSSQPKLLQELSLDAGRGGMSITSIFFRERNALGTIGSEAFSFSVSGPEERLSDFLRSLEKDRLIRFEGIQATRRSEGGNEVTTTTIEGKSFYLP